MDASRSSLSPPPTQLLSADGGALLSLFLDSDLDTHLGLSVAADSTIRGLKAQVAVEHAATFPELGPVVVKSFEVRRRGAMYQLSDSMPVGRAFFMVKAENFLHVNMAAAETDTREGHCRDEDRGRSSDMLSPMLKGAEDDGAWVTSDVHDVHPSSSSQRNTEGKSTTVCPASVEDHEIGFVSGNKQMVIREEKSGEVHAMGDLSCENVCKKARVTGSFDTSVENPPIRKTNDSKTRDLENLDKHPLEGTTNSHGVLSSTSCQQGVDGNIKEDSVKPENPTITQKKKKRRKSQSVASNGVCAQELTQPSTEAAEVPKATDEDLLHENQVLQGDGASNFQMARRGKTKVMPPVMLLSSSQQKGRNQVTKHVQLGTDAKATSNLGTDQSNIDLVDARYTSPILAVTSIFVRKRTEKIAKKLRLHELQDSTGSSYS